MNNINKQRGNALTGALGFAVIVGIIFFVGSLIMRQFQSIDDVKNTKLQNMVSEVKGTSFESPFKDNIKYYLQDGKITNNEFSSIEELYSGYKSSKLTGDDQAFSKKTKDELKQQYDADEFTSKLFTIMLFVFLTGFGGYMMFKSYKSAHMEM